MSANRCGPSMGRERGAPVKRSSSHWGAAMFFVLFAGVNLALGCWMMYWYFWPASIASRQFVGMVMGVLNLVCVPVPLWLAWRIVWYYRDGAARRS